METVQQTLNEMRAAFNQIPSSLRSIYLASLTTGYPTFSCLSSLMYNRVWCWEHGHLNAHKEAVRKQTTAEDTRRVVREGHSKRGVENIDLATVNGSEADAAVRDYEQGEWGATIIHYTPESKSKLMSKMSGNSNYAFNYWTTLIPEDVPYEQHAYVVKNVNWVLKRGLRTLQKHNVPFTLTGTSAAVLKDKAAPKSSSSRS